MLERISLVDLTDRYAFADLAHKKPGAQVKKTRARQAIVVIAPYYTKTRRLIFVLCAWAGRLSTEKLEDKIFEIAETFKPIKMFGIEANAMQSLFADVVTRDAKVRKVKVPFVPVYQDTKIDKDWGIRTTLQKEIAYHSLFFLRSQTEVISELVGFPLTTTKDIIDALRSAIDLVPVRSTKAAVDNEKEALAEYMRQAGHKPHEIQRRLGQI